MIYNPFPIGGIATLKSPYALYRSETKEKITSFIRQLGNASSARDLWQFLVISGDFGSGKTGILYYIKREIKKLTLSNNLVLHWQFGVYNNNNTFIFNFYNDFLMELNKYLEDVHDDPNFLHHFIDQISKKALQNIQVKNAIQNIGKLLEERYGYDGIVLLVDEFDIMIRNLKIPNFESIREFFIWYSPEDFKCYHLAVSVFTENLKGLYTKEDGTRIPSIHRRLDHVKLKPPANFEEFYENVYKYYLSEASVDPNFDIFDKDFLRFLYYISKKNFGTIFSILYSLFNERNKEIEILHEKFKITPTEEFQAISLYDLIFDDKGLKKNLQSKLIDILNRNNAAERKKIFINLIRNYNFLRKVKEIKHDLELPNSDVITSFKKDLIDLDILNDVFPKLKDYFFLDINYAFKMITLVQL